MHRFIVYNLDRHHTMPHVPLDTTSDRGAVYDTTRSEPHPITGQAQHVLVFSGTIPQCVAYVEHTEAVEHEQAETMRINSTNWNARPGPGAYGEYGD